MSVLDEIAEERARQVARGYPGVHDDQYTEGQLIHAALHVLNDGATEWPLEEPPPLLKRRSDRLVVAAALIVAEIERLDRASFP